MIRLRILTEIKEVDHNLKLIEDAVKAVRELDVLVGIPQEKNSRPGTISNAELAFIHTHGARTKAMAKDMEENMSKGVSYGKAYDLYISSKGSPLHRIPPRPIIEPAIENSKQQIGEMLKKPMQKALDGDKQGAIEALEKVGMQGQNIVRAWFTNPKNNWAPNSPETIKLKGSDKPLIDTGELRKSITYVVRKRGK